MMNLMLTELKSVICIDLICSLFVSFSARVGNRDAFYFKKSKSRIRKQEKELTKFQRVFWAFSLELTFVPNYCKLFYTVRILEMFFSLMVLVVLLLRTYFVCSKFLLILVLVREICINIPFIAFSFYNNICYRDPKNVKGWGFPY